MKPTTGTATNVASSNTFEKSQRLRDPMCRPTYDSAIPATSSPPDTAATQPAAHRRIRAVIGAPRRELLRWPAYTGHARRNAARGISHLLSRSCTYAAAGHVKDRPLPRRYGNHAAQDADTPAP